MRSCDTAVYDTAVEQYLKLHLKQLRTAKMCDEIDKLQKELGVDPEVQPSHDAPKRGKAVAEEVQELSLVEIINLITPEMYPDGLKGQEKSAITNSLNTLKGQIPKAFELCSALVMEAMPCESRKELFTYSRDDIIKRAEKEGINSPTARQIYQGLPAMLKK